MSRSIYLDYAAATPLDPGVQKQMQPYFTQLFYNPSATYLAAQAVAADIEKARAAVGQCLGARPSEIVFTAGGTEANNLAIHGVMQLFPGANLIVSAIEHESVLQPAGHYPRKLAPVDKTGLVDITALEKMIDNKTVLISIMQANNEIGTIQPLRAISALVAKVRAKRQKTGNTQPLYLHSDACQATNYLDIHVARLGVDLLTLNGGKIYGPKQSGALYQKAGIRLTPQIEGGGQEHGLRSGTENVANIIGFAAALTQAQSSRHEEARRLTALRDEAMAALQANLPNLVINGSKRSRLPNNIHFTIAGQDNERLMMQLDEQGIQVAVGSACSASSELPSHVLKAIGLSDAAAQASLRLTFGRSTQASDLQRLVQVLVQMV